MKMMIISFDEYERLKQALKGLGWTWKSYQKEIPDGWYEFKYSPILNQFVATDREEVLLSQVSPTFFSKYIKVPRPVYREMKELAAINRELQDVLEHPPFGSEPVSELIDY